jgi:hypothetical protein
LTVTVYVVPADSEFAGVKVPVVLALLNVTVPGTTLPFGSVTVNIAVLGTTGLEKVAVGAVETGLLDEPL